MGCRVLKVAMLFGDLAARRDVRWDEVVDVDCKDAEELVEA